MTQAYDRSMGERGSATDGADGIRLLTEYATALPELTVPWSAEPAADPDTVILNADVAGELGIDSDRLVGEAGAQLLLGQSLPAGAKPVAQAYAGHQFGMYSPRLGDGRALLLGEFVKPDGSLVDIHLKGSGPTPFSRGGDGHAALGPMLREYVIGEAMHALGVPTSRGLAVLTTGRMIPRDGDIVPGAVFVRVASSHLRVGTFQYARASGDTGLLRRLADFAIERHAPEVAGSDTKHADLLSAVVDSQAKLIAKWMLVGFVHGVMNTDNMTVSGESIDYGPCAFIDAYDPHAVFSSIDHGGRYAYGRQPAIGLWNLARLADALLPLLADEQEAAITVAQERLAQFPLRFETERLAGMRAKLGIAADDEATASLSAELLSMMADHRLDHTSCFRALAHAARGDHERLLGLHEDRSRSSRWLDTWLAQQPDPDAMDAVNPVVIPRNHLVQEALDAATAGSMEPFHRLLEAVRHPFADRPGFERYAQPMPEGSGRFVTYCGT